EPDGDIWALAQDEPPQRPRLGLRRRARPGVVDASEVPPAPREVAVEVDAVGVAARAGGTAVGVGAVDQEELDTGRRRDRTQRAGDRDPRPLASMDAPDDENLARRVGRADAVDDDRPPADRVADR